MHRVLLFFSLVFIGIFAVTCAVCVDLVLALWLHPTSLSPPAVQTLLTIAIGASFALSWSWFSRLVVRADLGPLLALTLTVQGVGIAYLRPWQYEIDLLEWLVTSLVLSALLASLFWQYLSDAHTFNHQLDDFT